jgi:hypothetical protein
MRREEPRTGTLRKLAEAVGVETAELLKDALELCSTSTSGSLSNSV